MNEAPTAGARDRLAWAAILLLASCLALWNLDGQLLWQDEAQTALLARSVLEFGTPTGYDGRNHLSQEWGAEYDDAFRWRWHTWLPFYLLAGFFALLGESTLAARLPFALLGIAAVAACFALGRALWGERRAAWFSAFALTTSVPFLLLTRQSRWYAAAACFLALALLGYVRTLQRAAWGGPLLALGVLLLFHAHYVYVASLTVGALLHTALWHRARLGAVVVWLGTALALCLPWLVWLAGLGYRRAFGDAVLAPDVTWRHLGAYAVALWDHAFPGWLLLVPAAVLLLRWRRSERPFVGREAAGAAGLLLLVGAGTLLVLAAVSPAPFFRYLAPLLPLVALAVGGIATLAARGHPLLGWLVVLLVAARGPVVPFLHELTHDLDGPIEALVDYLDEHAEAGDVVAITYGDLPLKFYTGLRVVGGLTGEDLSPALDADWIVLRHHVISPDMDGRVRRFLLRNVEWERYRRIELDVADLPFENREEPALHRFRNVERGPRLVLHRRVSNHDPAQVGGDARR